MSDQIVLTISSRNYGAWALRGWLMAKLSGIGFVEKIISPDDPAMRAEILLLSSSILVPSLAHGALKVWDTLAIGEYLNEIAPEARLLPPDRAARAFCRSICGEMHSGFDNLRKAMPMNIRAHFPGFRVWSRAQGDIDRIVSIWNDCLAAYGGPFLFGSQPNMADAMFAPVVTRFLTYDVKLDHACSAYCEQVMALEPMREWVAAAEAEADDIGELDADA